ncbi:MAG: hypothetical protein KDC33_01120 [Thermoleophilia bacterium]|nr:hypothetical protein [Thermoleophilia bacterium]
MNRRRTAAIAVLVTAVAACTAATAPAAPALRVTTATTGPPVVGTAGTVRVTVRNPSRMRATRVVVRVSGPPSVRVRPVRRAVGTIGARRARTVTVRVTPRTTAGLRAALRVTASAARFRPATAVRRLARTPAPGGGGAPADPFLGRVFTHFDAGVTGAIPPSYEAVVFTNPGWAYWGMPDGGLPTCSSRTGVLAADATAKEGCVPYTYDAATKRLTIDGTPVTVGAASDGDAVLTINGGAFLDVPVVPKGARYNVTLLYTYVYGFYPNQSVTRRWLTFSPDGRFVNAALTLGSSGVGDFQTSYAAAPPDTRGAYEFTAPGQLTLTYDDGTVSRRTAVAAFAPGPGQAYDPWKNWMVLDGASYNGDVD